MHISCDLHLFKWYFAHTATSQAGVVSTTMLAAMVEQGLRATPGEFIALMWNRTFEWASSFELVSSTRSQRADQMTDLLRLHSNDTIPSLVGGFLQESLTPFQLKGCDFIGGELFG